MIYEKIQPGDPSYERIKASLDAGYWVCDSLDHNDDENGCSNPECFKHDPPPPHWQKLNDDIDKMWKAMRSDPKHLDQLRADRYVGPEPGELDETT